MYDVLWHMRGSVALREVRAGDAIFRLSTLLRQQRKAVTTRSPVELAFDNSRAEIDFWRNWRALVMFERGRFWIDGDRVRYDLRSLHGFLFCLLAAGLAGAIVALFSAPLRGLVVAIVLMGWLYGMNLLIALTWVPALIRRTVAD
jgi:hypothetical protein